MKAGRELDATIALTVMGMKSIEPENIPHYSTNIYDAYDILKKMQQLGWFCNVGSRIGDDGSLFYKVKFYQHGRECERFSVSIPMSICIAAISVIKNEYFEYVDVLKETQDDHPIEIIPGAVAGWPFPKAEYTEDVTDILKKLLNDINGPTDEHDILITNILDELDKCGYMVVRKPPTIE